MPLLTSRDPVAGRPRRILVAGTSGSGKTTCAARIALVLGVPHVEIDALYHGPDWTPRASFGADVEAFSSTAGWATEWQYSQARPILAARADLLVWLDLGRPAVMRQVIGRTVRRRRHRQLLWNGNVEPPLRTIFTEPDHIIRWAWRTHAENAVRVLDLAGQRPGLPIVRVGSRREAHDWIAGPLRGSCS